MNGSIPREFASMPSALLREMVYLAEQREARRNPWLRLSEAAKAEALETVAAGGKLSFGWWESHIQRPDHSNKWPPMPPATGRNRRWQPWELTVAAIDMSDDRVATDIAQDVLADLAARHDLDAEALADAFTALDGDR